MNLKFGTSGVRGLVSEMTDRECFLYASAYLEVLISKSKVSKVCVSGDFRSSTPRIIAAIQLAIEAKGLEPIHCGYIPTPALAAYAMSIGAGSIMVTGSHIPDDRNGIKFYMTWGEILKKEEEEISKCYRELKESGVIGLEVDDFGSLQTIPRQLSFQGDAAEFYKQRYLDVFSNEALSGVKIVFYQHSTVGREIIPSIFESLGAKVIKVGWSNSFIPMDTEAVVELEKLSAWVSEHGADVLVSADGDGDRPLVVDDKGNVVRGDILGLLAAKALKADSISIPVSCNTAVEKAKLTERVNRTRIGSPFVIEAMNLDKDDYACVVGFEANGGFLTGSLIQPEFGEGVLAALPTRDAVLPVISTLILAKQNDMKLSELIKTLPLRFTSSGLIRNIPVEQGREMIESLKAGGESRVSELFGHAFGKCTSINWIDGIRMTFEDGKIVHYRPSGNAPEFRCYTEGNSEVEADEIKDRSMQFLKELLSIN